MHNIGVASVRNTIVYPVALHNRMVLAGGVAYAKLEKSPGMSCDHHDSPECKDIGGGNFNTQWIRTITKIKQQG